MKFLVQHNLINPDHLLEIQLAIKKYPHEFVGVLPFSHEITSDEPIVGTDYIPYGSTLFTTLAEKKGYKVFFDINKFNYTAFLENRDDMLNSNVMPLKDAIGYLYEAPEDKMFFTRPSEDLKAFTGMVEPAHKLLEWFKNSMITESSICQKFSNDMDVVLSEPVVIQAEWRYFVVAGKIVSGSMYRYRGNLHSARVVEEDILAEAQTFADKWLPHETVCMDLALVNDELKVIEFNCFNSSGFYDNNVEDIFDAIWEKYK